MEHVNKTKEQLLSELSSLQEKYNLLKQSVDNIKHIETEQRLINLFNASSNPIFIVNVTTKQLIDVNKAAIELYGYSKEEFLQLKSTDISNEPYETIKSINDKDGNIPIRYHKKKNGEVFPVKISGGYFEFNNEKFHTAIIHDLTEVNTIIEALRVSEENFKKAFSLAPIGLGISRMADGLILQVNKNWEKIFGYTSDEVIGKTSAQISSYNDKTERARMLELLIKQGYIHDYEIKMIAKSGEVKDILLSTEQLYYNHEQCIITIAIDITEKKKLNKI